MQVVTLGRQARQSGISQHKLKKICESDSLLDLILLYALRAEVIRELESLEYQQIITKIN